MIIAPSSPHSRRSARAWKDIDHFSYFDPEILRQYEPQGKVITVKESSKEQVDMRIIPTPAPEEVYSFHYISG